LNQHGYTTKGEITMLLGFKDLQSRPPLPWVTKTTVLLWGIGFPVGSLVAAVAIINL
jgi:hypothetical protein